MKLPARSELVPFEPIFQLQSEKQMFCIITAAEEHFLLLVIVAVNVHTASST